MALDQSVLTTSLLPIVNPKLHINLLQSAGSILTSSAHSTDAKEQDWWRIYIFKDFNRSKEHIATHCDTIRNIGFQLDCLEKIEIDKKEDQMLKLYDQPFQVTLKRTVPRSKPLCFVYTIHVSIFILVDETQYRRSFNTIDPANSASC